MAAAVTEALTGAGLWGVEFFLSHDNGVYFSELSPRPHDTGMVTLAGTQNLNEFELHLRAVLGIPIPAITFERLGASAVILSPVAAQTPHYEGVEEAVADDPRTDIRIFGKPVAREPPHGRRRGLRAAGQRSRRPARPREGRRREGESDGVATGRPGARRDKNDPKNR